MVIVEGKIKGKARPRFNTRTGRAYTPQETHEYENRVAACYRQQDGRYFDGPVKISIYLYFEIPKSYSKKKREAILDGQEYPTKKPDIDNCAKIILDALSHGVAMSDDILVCQMKVYKRYTESDERVEFHLDYLG